MMAERRQDQMLVIREPVAQWEGHASQREDLRTGFLEGSIVAIRPVVVGVGRTSDVVAPFFEVNRKPTIPGSALKGAFRSLFEAITRSCYPHQDAGPFRRCSEDGTNGRFCPACKVFGGLGYAGRVRICPAVAPDDVQLVNIGLPIHRHGAITQIGSTRRRVFGNRQLASARARRVQALAEGTHLSFRLDFSNLLVEELGLLAIVLGQEMGPSRIYPRVGGAKAQGCGVISVKIDRLKLVMPQSFTKYRRTVKTFTIPDELQAAIGHAKAFSGFYQPGYDKLVAELNADAFDAF